MTDSRALMQRHVEALFTLDGSGRMLSTNEPDSHPAPRFFLGRTTGGNLWCVRHDVGRSTAAELAALAESEPLATPSDRNPRAQHEYARVLSREEQVRRTWSGPAYRFPEQVTDPGSTLRLTLADADLLAPRFDDWRPELEAGAPMVVALARGRAVSLCCSVRITDAAHEAGVKTHPEFRGRGYAGRVVGGWAHYVRSLGRIPLYSTSWKNRASRSVARKLSLIQFGTDFHIT